MKGIEMLYIGIVMLVVSLAGAAIITWIWWPLGGMRPYKQGEDLHKRFHVGPGDNTELDRQIESHNNFEKEMAIWYSRMALPGFWGEGMDAGDLTEKQGEFLKDKGIFNERVNMK